MKYRQDRKTWKGIAPIMSALIMGFALAIGLNLTACKGKNEAKIEEDRPTEEQGRAAVLEDIKVHQQDKYIKLLTFRKTNGISSDVFGVKKYTMEGECEIEFLGDCIWNGRLQTQQGPPDSCNAKRGKHAKAICSEDFERTENGWRPHY
jgi:hypothetical protein